MNQNDRRRLAELCGLRYILQEIDSGFIVYEYYDKNGMFVYTDDAWHPNESIEQAMMVAEALKQSGLYLLLTYLKTSYRACFKLDMVRELFCSLHHTPAGAICAAALAALGEKK